MFIAASKKFRDSAKYCSSSGSILVAALPSSCFTKRRLDLKKNIYIHIYKTFTFTYSRLIRIKENMNMISVLRKKKKNQLTYN